MAAGSVGGAVKGVVDVLGVAGSITTALALAALSLLIAYLLAGQWLRGRSDEAKQAIAAGNDESLARLLGGVKVPLDGLPPESKLELAREDLRARFRGRVVGHALLFFAFLALLAFALALAFMSRESASPAPGGEDGLVRLGQIQALDIIRMVPPEEREVACAKLLTAAECARAAPIFAALEFRAPTPAQAEAVSDVVERGGVTTAQFRELAACGGSFSFRVAGGQLLCADGAPVPILRPARSLAPLTGHDAIVFHSTASSEGSFDAIARLMAGGRENLPGPLGHLLISRNGAVVQFAPLSERAIHAGMGVPWRGLKINNANSIGVEMINQGGASGQPFTQQQVAAAKGIARALVEAYGIRVIVGHSDIAPGRKIDPGPLFPIAEVRRAAGLPPA